MIAFRVDEKLMEKIEEMAKELRVSKSDVVRLALYQYMSKYYEI